MNRFKKCAELIAAAMRDADKYYELQRQKILEDAAKGKTAKIIRFPIERRFSNGER